MTISNLLHRLMEAYKMQNSEIVYVEIKREVYA